MPTYVKINKLYGPEDQFSLREDLNNIKNQKNIAAGNYTESYYGWISDSITDLFKLKDELKPTRVIAYFDTDNKRKPYSEYLGITYKKYTYLESVQFISENDNSINELVNDRMLTMFFQ